MTAKPVRTETTTREIAADGSVLKETTTVVTVEQPAADDPPIGMYL